MEYSQDEDSYKGTINAEINIVPSLWQWLGSQERKDTSPGLADVPT